MSEELYTKLLGCSWELIKELGFEDQMRWELWRHFHPTFSQLLDGLLITGMFMIAPRKMRRISRRW